MNQQGRKGKKGGGVREEKRKQRKRKAEANGSDNASP